MSNFNLDREIILNIVAMIMVTVFCINVIMLGLAIMLRKEGKKGSNFYNVFQVISIVMGAFSILISIFYWCILR